MKKRVRPVTILVLNQMDVLNVILDSFCLIQLNQRKQTHVPTTQTVSRANILVM